MVSGCSSDRDARSLKIYPLKFLDCKKKTAGQRAARPESFLSSKRVNAPYYRKAKEQRYVTTTMTRKVHPSLTLIYLCFRISRMPPIVAAIVKKSTSAARILVIVIRPSCRKKNLTVVYVARRRILIKYPKI